MIKSQRLQPYLVWIGLILYVIICKIVLSFLPPVNVKVVASEFLWSTIAAYLIIGLTGIIFYNTANFVLPLGPEISNTTRFLNPFLVGTGLATLAILIDFFSKGTTFIEKVSGEKSFNVYFPASLLVYTGGILLVDAVFKILPLSLFTFLVILFTRKKEPAKPQYLGIAILVSLFEPLTQGLGIISLQKDSPMGYLLLTQFLPYFITNFPLNLAQCLFFRKYGFISSMVTRAGFYLIWHVVYGNFIYPIYHS